MEEDNDDDEYKKKKKMKTKKKKSKKGWPLSASQAAMGPFVYITDANLSWKREKSTWLKTMCVWVCVCVGEERQNNASEIDSSICELSLWICAPFNGSFPAEYIHDCNRLCQCTLRFVSRVFFFLFLLNSDVYPSFCVAGGCAVHAVRYYIAKSHINTVTQKHIA